MLSLRDGQRSNRVEVRCCKGKERRRNIQGEWRKDLDYKPARWSGLAMTVEWLQEKKSKIDDNCRQAVRLGGGARHEPSSLPLGTRQLS